MIKKVLCAATVLIGLFGAGYVYASREYSVTYEYLDENGFNVGVGYIDCNGRFYLEGEKTNNFYESSREPCHSR